MSFTTMASADINTADTGSALNVFAWPMTVAKIFKRGVYMLKILWEDLFGMTYSC